MLRRDWIKLVIYSFLATGLSFYLLADVAPTRLAYAYSSGPPAGFTGAPGEFTCAECHVPDGAGVTGQLVLDVPTAYVPGQIYPITVRHINNSDLTRKRWGFELTALDDGQVKAGELQNTDVLTQVLDNQGAGGARQYIEHTSAGSFLGQTGGASWTFNWVAPTTDVGRITFHVAGNQANGDGNTSGDTIYFTFAEVFPVTGFTIAATPPSQTVIQGSSANYQIAITPSGGFIGPVTFAVSGQPAGASATFDPASLNITDTSAKNTTLTVTTAPATTIGPYTLNITGTSGPIQHSASVKLKVANPANADLNLSQTVSPNPAVVGINVSYRIAVGNAGPAAASNVTVTDDLPAGMTFVSATPTQGSCSGVQNVNCALGSLAASATAFVTVVATPTSTGTINNTASVAASETDPDASDNSATTSVLVGPAAVSPTMLDPNLTVGTIYSGLNQPTSMAFIGPNDFFVLEKTTGKVQRIVNGALHSTALDLPVNGASERGLLGIALHPQFNSSGYVYLYWTESSTGADSVNIDEIPLLGNRVDRYVWNGATLAFDRNLIKLRSLQQDASNGVSRGNHDGGVLRFGQDGKLYILFGDNGRRGFLQNVTSGGTVPDDQFGGPEPDDAHLTGVILRLNGDGSTPVDNPFYNANTALTGQAAANVKKVFAYGVRNGFGMAVDSLSGELWTQENGDDAFDELNRVRAGFNGGWIQVMGPISRIAEFKSIESTYGAGNLQQLRWPPSNIADTPQDALSRLYLLPNAQYTDPEFSWRYAVAPSPLGFVKGRGLGPEYEGNMLVGGSRTTLVNGYLFRFRLSTDRLHFSFSDPRLADLVADNADKFDLTESESLLIGRDFGITTDIQNAPNGNVFVVSLSNGAVYEIKSKPAQLFVATLNGAQEVPATNSPATGTATLILSPDEQSARLSLNFAGLTSAENAAHIHGPAAPGVIGDVIAPLQLGQLSDFPINLTATQVQNLKDGLLYVNVHTATFPNGEIRGQFGVSPEAATFEFAATKTGVGEAEAGASVTITRSGNTTGVASVDYSTDDAAGANNCSITNGNASSRCDYETISGTVHFMAGETAKTISIPIVNDSYAEGAETFTVTLSNAIGATLGSPGLTTVTINDNDTFNGANPIDQADFFVRQHYLDFLNREPDAGGFAFWTNQITSCGVDVQCIEVRRINVSAAFFLSIEFQETGYLVERMYKASYGDAIGTSTVNGSHQLQVPVIRFHEFLADKQQISQGLIVLTLGWEQLLENNKQAFLAEFVQRSRFTTAYPTTMTPAQFVDALFAHAGVTPLAAERASIINEFNGAGNIAYVIARAHALRRVAENSSFAEAEKDKAFVLMQYFGYLRRDPDDLPDSDYSGYDFWLTKLNQFNGNFVNAEMVKAFLVSGEYRGRFGP
jgi:aldose sugar dehydrogenase